MQRQNQKREGSISHSTIFKVSPQELVQLFDRDQPEENRLQNLQQQHHGVEGLMHKVVSAADSGIMGDNGDISRRQYKYSKNTKPITTLPPFKDSMKDAMNDRILLVVAVFAILSIIPGMIVEAATGWVEGVFILIALFVQVLITAFNDYSKDKKFVQLQSLNRDEELPVLRGKKGQTQTLSVWEFVVGDVIEMQPGDKIPADCLVISSANLIVREITKVSTSEDEYTKFKWDDLKKNAFGSPFLFADSFVIGGTCKALVCAVGEHSSRGIHDTAYNTQEQNTELSRKLDNIGGSLRFFGLICAIAILATSTIVLVIQTSADEDVGGKIFTKKMIDNVVISIIILIVAIPEGLPMTVTVSLAHSVLQMKSHDNVLVRDLSSVEQVGTITDLCLGKTGTMTTEEMEVVNFYTQNIFVLNSRKNTLLNCDLDKTIIEKLCESIVFNSQCHIEMTENSFYVPVGNGTEVSLIKWLQDAEIPVHEIMARKEGRIVAHVPFNSTLKRSIVAVQLENLHDTVRVYVKGAPEIVIPNCRNFYNSPYASASGQEKQAEKQPLGDSMKQDMLETHFRQNMGQKALRAIAFSYSDMSLGEFERLMQSMGDEWDNAAEIASLEQNQTFLAMVGLKDPIRASIKGVVKETAMAGIQMRLISGDSLDTSIAVAYDVGILTPAEYKQVNGTYVALNASDFRQIVGDVEEREDEVADDEEQTHSYRLSAQGQEEFNRIIGDLKVIGRAEPEDKLRLVAGLRGMGEKPEDDNEDAGPIVPTRIVAVVGEGINDVKSFKAAQVSFAVQSGTSYARNNASMVLLTNDFDSCMRAVMWGRNIYMNVQRFLQFQITCNLAVLSIVIFSYITMTESCLNAVQLIYINLIMDILGALALAATRPQTDIAHSQYSGQGRLMTPQMYRQIICVGLYMFGMMIVVCFGGKSMFDKHYELSTQTIDKTQEGKDKMAHFTLIWNTFVMLQVFNLINCRDVGRDKFHGFSMITRNFLTMFVILVIFGVQMTACFTFLGRPVFEASSEITMRQFGICVVIGSSTIAANAIFKFIPNSWIEKRMPALNEDSAIGGSSKLMGAYDKQAKAKAYTGKGKTDEPLEQESFEHDDDYRQVQ